jgi:hypothetical protein
VIETAEQGFRDEIAARLGSAGFIADEILLTAELLPVDPRHNSKIDYGSLRSRLQSR